jgi:hypothetical protein
MMQLMKETPFSINKTNTKKKKNNKKKRLENQKRKTVHA